MSEGAPPLNLSQQMLQQGYTPEEVIAYRNRASAALRASGVSEPEIAQTFGMDNPDPNP